MTPLEQAQAWRANSRPERRDKLALDDMSDDDLVRAYRTWWHAYTRGIQTAPSRRSQSGVSEYDARAAGSAADDAVLALNLPCAVEGRQT